MKINVNRKIIINGKEYKSADELPPVMKSLFDMAKKAGVLSAGKVVFNGKEYASAADMPEDERKLYEDALAFVKGGIPSVATQTSSLDIMINGSPAKIGLQSLIRWVITVGAMAFVGYEICRLFSR